MTHTPHEIFTPESSLPSSEAAERAQRIVRTLRAAGFEAFLAGGCVRDMLLGTAPKDFDVATSARPEDLKKLFAQAIPVGAAFGVILVVEGSVRTEVATFREDGVYADGRHPESVTFVDARHDVLRRDFTINAMLYDPEKKEVHDYVGGREDMKNRCLRAVGDSRRRFSEDKLRLLRAVRFAARLEFELEQSTRAAIEELAETVATVSAERIRDELVNMFTGTNPGDALRLLHTTGLLKVVLPEIAIMEGVAQPPQFHPEGDVLVHTAMVLDGLSAEGDRPPSAALAIGALLHDVGKPPTFSHAPGDRIRFMDHARVGAEMAGAICRRLKFSNEDREQIVALVASHMRFMDAQRMRRATLRRFIGQTSFDEHLRLHRADCLSSHGMLDNYELCSTALKEEPPLEKETPLLGGRYLIDCGLTPGPLFSTILDAAYDAQLSGDVSTPEEAQAWAQEHFSGEFNSPT